MFVRIGCGIFGILGLLVCCFAFGVALFVAKDSERTLLAGVGVLVFFGILMMAVSK